MRLSPLMIVAALIAAPAAAQDNNAAAANATEVIASNDIANEAVVDANAMPAEPAPELGVAPATEPTPAPAPAPAKQSFPWGVLGLVGLIGLLGKRRRSS